MADYTNKEFQNVYNGIVASMGTDAQLKANLEAALRPMYEQSLAQLQQRRRENNAAIDVDAASRGMGNSTWVTDAKLRQLKDTEGNIATLNANYNNQLFGQLMDAIADRDNNAYNQAMQQYANGMIEGTMPYQQQQLDLEKQRAQLDQLRFQLEQAQNAAKGSGGGNGWSGSGGGFYADGKYWNSPQEYYDSVAQQVQTEKAITGALGSTTRLLKDNVINAIPGKANLIKTRGVANVDPVGNRGQYLKSRGSIDKENTRKLIGGAANKNNMVK